MQPAGVPSGKDYPTVLNNHSGLLLMINIHRENLKNVTFFQPEHWQSHGKYHLKYLNTLQDDKTLHSKSS